MATSYKKVYGMLKVTTWVGEDKPDAPQINSSDYNEELIEKESDLNEVSSEILQEKLDPIETVVEETQPSFFSEQGFPEETTSFSSTKKETLGQAKQPKPCFASPGDRKKQSFFQGKRSSPRPPLTSTNTQVGYLGYGLNVQAALYKDPNLLSVLRLFSIGEINRKYPNTQFIFINNYKEAKSLGAFRKASITIQAVDSKTVYPLFGKIHTTTILISSCAVISEISTFLSHNSFKVGPNNVAYKIVPNSVKLITTRTISAAIC